MNTERLQSTDHPDWPTIWRLYEASFPPGERRKIDGQEAVIGEPNYFLELWRNDKGVLVGFTACWIYEDFRFLEHFAVDPRQRGGGYGTRILTEWMQRPGPIILLEIDPITDEISRRRQAFYRRLGYLDNESLTHSHPSYQDGTGIVPLLLMSYPNTVDKELHQRFVRLQCEEMLAHLRSGEKI